MTGLARRNWLGDSALLAWLTFGAAAIAVVGGATLVAVLAVAVAALKGVTSSEELVAAASTYWALMATIVVSQLAMAAVALGAWWCTGAPFRERLGLTAPRIPLRDSIIILLAGGVPFLVSLGVASLLPSIQDSEAVPKIWSDSSVARAVLWVGVIGLLPGLVEEVLFRGLVLRGFMHRYSPVLAIVLTAILFALVHIDPPAMGLAMTMGIWFGFIAWRTGSIVLPILTHIIVNAGWNIAMFVAFQLSVDETTQIVALCVVSAVALPAFVWSLAILKRAGRLPPVPQQLP